MPAHTTTPSHHRAHVHKVDISKRLAHGTVYMHLPSARRSDSSLKRTLLQSARHHQRSAFAHSVTIISCCQIKTVVKTTSKQINFPEIFSSSLKSLVLQPAVASAGQVAVSDSRWRMWRSWPGKVTNGLQLWGWLNVLQNFRKIHWRNLTVVKWRFKSRSTGLVDVPAASMPTTHSL